MGREHVGGFRFSKPRPARPLGPRATEPRCEVERACKSTCSASCWAERRAAIQSSWEAPWRLVCAQRCALASMTSKGCFEGPLLERCSGVTRSRGLTCVWSAPGDYSAHVLKEAAAAFRSAAAAMSGRCSAVARVRAESADAHPTRSGRLMASVGPWLPSLR